MNSTSTNAQPTYDVVIVGAGWAGIFALKHCQEKGLSAIVLEATHKSGGQWIYDKVKPGGVLPTTTSVSSKLYMSPSDFPLPDHVPEFPSSEEIYQHFCDYMDHFSLHEHIDLNTRVDSVMKENDTWAVQATNQKQEVKVYHSKNIVIATGANMKPKYPSEKMYNNFSGTTSHIAEYKGDTSEFCGKRVLMIGGSDSGCDMAHAIKEDAKSITVSMRKGAWFQGREFGEFYPEHRTLPADMAYNRLVNNIVGVQNIAGLVQKTVTSRWGVSGSDIPEWKTSVGYVDSYYVKSRQLVHDVKAGKVQAKRGVREIEGKMVWFHGQEEPEAFDHIVFATGYDSKANFQAPFQQTNDRYNLILDVDDPSVAWLGYCRPYLTSFVMILEMQALWMATAFANELNISVPLDVDERRAEAAKELQYLQRRFPLWDFGTKLMYLIDPYRYCDILANDMGMRPNLTRTFFMNPVEWFRLVTCSWSQYHYFLHDKSPKKQAIARDEMKKVLTHPVSKIVRGDTLFTFLWMPFLFLLSTMFGRRSKIALGFKKLGVRFFKSRVTSTLKMEDLAGKDLRLCLAAQLVMADGILGTRKLNWLESMQRELGVARDLEEVLKFSRITSTEDLVKHISGADRPAALLDLDELVKSMGNARVLDENEICQHQLMTDLLRQQEVQTPTRTSGKRSQAHCTSFRIETAESPEAIVLLLGWLGANPKHLQKHTKAYKNATSIQVVARQLDCVTGNERNLNLLASQVIEETATQIRNLKNPACTPVIIHSFSGAGPIVLGQINLLLDAADTPDALLVRDHLKLQIFDSGPVFPKLENAIRGIKNSIPNPILQIPFIMACWFFVQLGKFQEKWQGRPSASTQYWSLMKDAQAMPAQAYIYSKEDHFGVSGIEELIAYRKLCPKSRTETLKFDTGRHCCLLREHEDRYCAFVECLVKESQLAMQNKTVPRPGLVRRSLNATAA